MVELKVETNALTDMTDCNTFSANAVGSLNGGKRKRQVISKAILDARLRPGPALPPFDSR